jgi:DNA-binding transcriptional LysR family regulator
MSREDRLTLMHTFVKIVEAGSLSAAAAQLRTTQPTVSRRLQALERSLGVPLLQRSTHQMKLTAEGARCFERSKDLLLELESFEADLRGRGDEPTGLLRVVVPHAFGQERLVAPLAKYLARHPRVAVEWVLHDDTPNFIADGIDCAIHVGPVTDPSVVAMRLAEVPRIVVGAPALVGRAAKARHPSALADLPWLALRTYYRTEVALRHGRTGEAVTLAIRPRLSTDSLYALRSAAVLGVGVAVGSAWVMQEDLARRALVRLAPEWEAEPLPVSLVYPKAPFQAARLRRFIELMRASVSSAVGGGPLRPRSA